MCGGFKARRECCCNGCHSDVSARSSGMEIEPYVTDVLLPDLVGHDRQPSAFLTYLYLYRHRAGGGAEIPLRTIAEGTGLSKRSVQSAIAHLEARGLIRVERETITSPGRYFVLRPWRRGEKR